MYRYFFAVIIVATSVSVTAIPSRAFDFSGGSRFAVADFANKMSRCIAFYAILGQGKDHRGNDAAIFQNLQDLSEKILLKLLIEVRKFGIKEETIVSYVENYTKEMGRDMEYDAINVSIIINKHGAYCKNFTNNWQREWYTIKNSSKYN